MRALNRACLVLAAATLACGDLTPDIYIDRPSEEVDGPEEAGGPLTRDPPPSAPRTLPAAPPSDEAGAPRFDWSIESVGALPGILVPGRTSPIAFEVQNRGDDPAPATSLSIVLESGAPIGQLGQRRFELARMSVPTLQAGEAYRDTVEVFVRNAIAPSTYGLVTHVDPDNVHPELDESNNTWLHGSIRVSPVVLDKTELRFKGVAPGCAEIDSFTLRNLSDRVVRFAPSTLSSAEFRLSRGSGVLAPGASAAFQVQYQPQAEGIHQERIDLDVDGQRGLPLGVDLSGQSIDFPIRVDELHQDAGPRIDMVLVAADGPGMNEEWEQLAGFVPQIIDRLRSQEVRFRIAVARTGAPDMMIGPVVDHRQPDAIQHLLELVQRGAAESAEAGENRELFATADRLLEGPLDLRPEAGLALVFLSNADDASPPPPGCAPGRPTEACYRQRFVDVKSGFGGAHQVTVHGVFEVDSCIQGRAERLWHLASDLGGTIDSVCEEDAFTAFWRFSDPRFGMNVEFQLGATPVPGSAGVHVHGERVPAYDFLRAQNVWWVNGRELQFLHGRQPTAGQPVSVEYLTRCEIN